MTLLITVATADSIHQSSDYRLSDKGIPVETRNGSKQLSVQTINWHAQISFTGIAKDGQGYDTRAWLKELAISHDPEASVESFVNSIATTGSARLRTVTGYDQRLTIVIGVATTERCRLFIISNWERPTKPPTQIPDGVLEWTEVPLSAPRIMINGYRKALPPAARKWLHRLIRKRTEPHMIRSAIAALNKLAASTPSASNFISQECWVQSLLRNGRFEGQNQGEVAGVPAMLMLGQSDLGQWIEEEFPPEPGKQLTLIQSFGGQGTAAPAPTEIGEPRDIRYSSPHVSSQFLSAGTLNLATLTMTGYEGTLTLRKNLWVPASFGNVEFKIEPALLTAYPKPGLVFKRLQLPSVPTVDGAQPRSWQYSLDLHFDGMEYTLIIRQNSMAFRSANHEHPLPVLSDTEELVMVAPVDGLILRASKDSPLCSAVLPGRFLLRDFPELRQNN